jgi:Asp-tRNA(Asn)/Glu-tRNA(Gln) amidotransferase A subunit family amidase
MKAVGVLLAMLTLGGCATVAEIEQTHETMDVMSGKDPQDYTQCLARKLAATRGPVAIDKHGSGYKVVVPRKLSSGPAAVIDVQERSGGSTIKVHERLSNLPLRFKDVQKAATECISG